ncbi:MAG: glycosyltransferase family 2 protein [Bacteroidota bacterium]
MEKRALYSPLIQKPPDSRLALVVVIPAFDEPHLQKSLEALLRCDLPEGVAVEIIVVINDAQSSPIDLKDRQQQQQMVLSHWAESINVAKRQFFLLHLSNLADKQAGVGLARKIGMDEAVRRLEAVENPEGVIACFDADTNCDPNYLQEVHRLFSTHLKAQACSIYYEHPLSGTDYPPAIYEAITAYELHLRYFLQAKRLAGFPYAYETIGSAMAVRCKAYQQQGGMNRRKAGEDFYFLNKFTQLGHFHELTTTRILPSPRSSHRVPFGTGRAIGAILSGTQWTTYALQSFLDLQTFFQQIPSLYDLSPDHLNTWIKTLPQAIATFLQSLPFEEKCAEIRQNTSSSARFEQRFYRWFDAFMLMKYVHFARDHFYPDVACRVAAIELLERAYGVRLPKADEKELLLQFRELDRRKT